MSNNIRSLIQKHDLFPKRSLGQNFLVDETYLDIIISAAELDSTDLVLEIGPGLGGLTRRLAQSSAQVVAVELDDRLIELLQAEFIDAPQITIVHADILKSSLSALMIGNNLDDAGAVQANHIESAPVAQQPIEKSNRVDRRYNAGKSYKVVANLPYYITNNVLRHLLEAEFPPTDAIIMVQKEVAQRICATPGKLSLLAISVQFYAAPTLVKHVPAGAFYPKPKVDSAILHLDLFPQPALDNVDPKRFFRIVKAGFGQKRKQLLNSLSAGLGLPKENVVDALTKVEVDPKRRAETLSIPEWGAIYGALEE